MRVTHKFSLVSLPRLLAAFVCFKVLTNQQLDKNINTSEKLKTDRQLPQKQTRLHLALRESMISAKSFTKDREERLTQHHQLRLPSL